MRALSPSMRTMRGRRRDWCRGSAESTVHMVTRQLQGPHSAEQDVREGGKGNHEDCSENPELARCDQGGDRRSRDERRDDYGHGGVEISRPTVRGAIEGKRASVQTARRKAPIRSSTKNVCTGPLPSFTGHNSAPDRKELENLEPVSTPSAGGSHEARERCLAVRGRRGDQRGIGWSPPSSGCEASSAGTHLRYRQRSPATRSRREMSARSSATGVLRRTLRTARRRSGMRPQRAVGT